MDPDVIPVIAVLREGDRLLALIELQVTGLQGEAELGNLVAGVVDIELPGDLITGPVQHGGQAVADGAAPGVAHVHRAGGVGGDKFHVDLLAMAVIGAAVLVPQGENALHNGGEPSGPYKKVDEAGAGHLRPLEGGALQVHLLTQDLGNLPGGHGKGLGAGHGGVGGKVALGGIGGDLHHKGGQGGVLEGPGGNGPVEALLHQLPRLGVGLVDAVLNNGAHRIHSSAFLSRFTPVPVSFRIR